MASFLPIAFIYSVNKGITISRILLHYGLPVRCHIPDLASYMLYFAIIIIVTRYVSKLSSKLDKIEIKSSDVKEISSASYTFVATFLGYIFVSLSINNLTTLSIIYIALVAVCSYADIYPYNPVFHFLKYHYYFIETGKKKILVISKKSAEDIEIDGIIVRTINNLSFIE